MRLRSLLCLFAILTGTSGTAIADAPEPISIVLTAAPSSPLNFNVTVTISNNGDVPIIISQAHLPFDWGGPLPNDQFRIKTYYNDSVQYLETYAEIDQDDPAAYVTLKGHASLSGIVNLHDSYKFFGVVNAYDVFKVKFVLKLGDVLEADAPDQSSPDYSTNPNRPREIVSNELTTYFTDNTARAAVALDNDKSIVLDGNSTRRLLALASSPPDGSSINDPRGTCDQSHAAVLDQAIFNAGEVASKSDDLIRDMFPPLGYPPATVSSGLFLKWFGKPDVINYPSSAADYNGFLGTVVGHYKAVWTLASVQKQGKKYIILTSCDCPASRPAYVVA